MRKNVLYYTRIIILFSCTELPSKKSSSNAVSVMMRCKEIFNIDGFLFNHIYSYISRFLPVGLISEKRLSINNFVVPEKK